jgi:uncharacterized phage protein gp47/JayE
MTTIKFAPLESPELDPRSEFDLVEYGIDRVYSASGGKLNDFAAGAPTRALIEGQAFAGAELLYAINQLPEALAIEVLKIAGIQRRLGSAAQATLAFTLTAPLASPFVVPINFEAKAADLIFRTDTQLIIPAGSISGSVAATCQTIGSIGNTAPYSITTITTPLAFLSAVTNPLAASGGTDAETLDDTKARAFQALRRRGLVSQDDYEEETRILLGVGSVALAIGNLAADRSTFQRGVVHIFALNQAGLPLSSAQSQALQVALQGKTHMSALVYVSSIEVELVDLWVIAKLPNGLTPQTIADDINQSLRTYLQPGTHPIGQTVILKELEYLVRNESVDYVQSVTIGPHLGQRNGANYPMPNSYSAVKLEALTVEFVQGTNQFSYTYGNGDPD